MHIRHSPESLAIVEHGLRRAQRGMPGECRAGAEGPAALTVAEGVAIMDASAEPTADAASRLRNPHNMAFLRERPKMAPQINELAGRLQKLRDSL